MAGWRQAYINARALREASQRSREREEANKKGIELFALLDLKKSLRIQDPSVFGTLSAEAVAAVGKAFEVDDALHECLEEQAAGPPLQCSISCSQCETVFTGGCINCDTTCVCGGRLCAACLNKENSDSQELEGGSDETSSEDGETEEMRRVRMRQEKRAQGANSDLMTPRKKRKARKAATPTNQQRPEVVAPPVAPQVQIAWQQGATMNQYVAFNNFNAIAQQLHIGTFMQQQPRQ